MGQQGVLDSTETILHFGGTESYSREITAAIWSGYASNFLPLVGSGYHVLVSDFGSEGSYYITACSPDRLQDFKQCAGNRVYRVNLTLKKNSVVTNKALVATGTNGLYYTSDIMLDDSSNPVWTLLDGTYGINQMSTHQGNPLSLQIILASNGNAYLRQQGDSSWTEILTPSQAATITGAAGTHYIRTIHYNTWKDRIFAVVERSTGLSFSYIEVFYTDNKDGTGWNYTTIYDYLFTDNVDLYGSMTTSPLTGTFTKGNVMWMSHLASSDNLHWSSVDGGASWSPFDGYNLQSGGFIGRVVSSQENQDECYTANNGDHKLYLMNNYDPGGGGVLTTEPYSGPSVFASAGDLYISPGNDTYMVVFSEDGIKESANGGVNWTQNYVFSYWRRADGLDFNNILMGRTSNADVDTSWHVVASTPDQGSTRYGKAGSDPQTPNSTSIPYDCGGIASGGIVVWTS